MKEKFLTLIKKNSILVTIVITAIVSLSITLSVISFTTTKNNSEPLLATKVVEQEDTTINTDVPELVEKEVDAPKTNYYCKACSVPSETGKGACAVCGLVDKYKLEGDETRYDSSGEEFAKCKVCGDYVTQDASSDLTMHRTCAGEEIPAPNCIYCGLKVDIAANDRADSHNVCQPKPAKPESSKEQLDKLRAQFLDTNLLIPLDDVITGISVRQFTFPNYLHRLSLQIKYDGTINDAQAEQIKNVVVTGYNATRNSNLFNNDTAGIRVDIVNKDIKTIMYIDIEEDGVMDMKRY